MSSTKFGSRETAFKCIISAGCVKYPMFRVSRASESYYTPEKLSSPPDYGWVAIRDYFIKKDPTSGYSENTLRNDIYEELLNDDAFWGEYKKTGYYTQLPQMTRQVYSAKVHSGELPITPPMLNIVARLYGITIWATYLIARWDMVTKIKDRDQLMKRGDWILASTLQYPPPSKEKDGLISGETRPIVNVFVMFDDAKTPIIVPMECTDGIEKFELNKKNISPKDNYEWIETDPIPIDPTTVEDRDVD